MSTTETQYDWEVEIAELLVDMSDVQQGLLDVLTEKRDLMVAGDIEGMTAVQSREEDLAQQLEECHLRRRDLLQRTASEGLPAKSLDRLTDVLPFDRRRQLQSKLRETNQRNNLVRNQSLSNWVLAQRSLLHLSQLLDIIATQGRSATATYTPQGEEATAGGALVDGTA